MKSFEINGTVRTNLGSKDASDIRRNGMVPCVIYGGKENFHFYADIREISKVLITPEVYNVKINLGDKTLQTVVRDAQYHPVTDRALHVDFLELVEGKKVSISLPITVEGTSPGVIAGGKLRMGLRRIKVKGLPSALPDSIKVDIGKLRIGDSIKVGQLSVENVEFLDAKNLVVVSVKTARAAAVGDEPVLEGAVGETAGVTEAAE